MANPRKFSEKIALHNHRQAEETAAFEQIMKEVNEVTTKVIPDRSTSKNTLRINSQVLGAFRGGSLPNVSATTPSVQSPPQNNPEKDELPIRAPTCRSRERTQGGPIRRPHDRRLDTSPYSSGNISGTYLTLPTDTGWRRTHSDPAIHQSTMQVLADRNNDMSHRGWNIPMMNGPDRNPIERSRSNPRVPGISVHPSEHDPGMMQMPLQNTGSLPDLTNVDFASPIHVPLDQDHNSSPYGSSPVNTSPSNLSPTSLPQGIRPPNRFQFTPVSHAHSNHLSVPHSLRYQHPQQNINKNIHLDKNMVNLVDSDFTQLQDMTGMYQQCSPTSPSPTLQQTANFRSPGPSPRSSPSPVGRNSAPCSPGVPSPLPNEYHIMNQQAQFQQHFEKLSVFDPPSPIAYTDVSNNAPPPLLPQSHSAPPIPDLNSMGNVELTSDPGYYSTSPSQLVYPSTSPRHHTTTPNTPTSLPEIVLTDCDDMSRQDSFPTDFFSEEAFKEDLGSLDFDACQLLSSTSMGIADGVEDDFRLDHRS